METAELLSLVEHLEENIDDLEEKLEPLLASALETTTKKLPLLDKAKLYVLIVYAVESLLFSYLRLNGVNAKDHAIFKELTRVKQYFEKIKAAEEGTNRPRQNLSLDKPAAARIIKHSLSGHDRKDLERAEREAKERLMAKRKVQALDQRQSTKSMPEEGKQNTKPEPDSDQDGAVKDTEADPKQPPSTNTRTQSNDSKRSKKREKRPESQKLKKAEGATKKLKRKQEQHEEQEGRRGKRKREQQEEQGGQKAKRKGKKGKGQQAE